MQTMSEKLEQSLLTEPLKAELVRLLNEAGGAFDHRALVDRFSSSVCRHFFPGEKIRLKIKRNGRFVTGVITGNGSCSLKVRDDSSSKSNKGQSRSPSKLLSTYDIRVDDEKKVISSVPGSDIVRCARFPSKEALMLFVRKMVEVVSCGGFQSSPVAKDSTTSRLDRIEFPRLPFVPSRKGTSAASSSRKRKSGLNCADSNVTLPKMFRSTSPSELNPQLKLVRLDVPVKKQCPMPSKKKKLKQMTLFEMTSKITLLNEIDANALSRGSNEMAEKRKTLVTRALKPLPEPKPFVVPSGFPSVVIGDSLLIVEFIICYREFLRPEKSLVLSFAHFADALLAGPDGFFYLNHLLVSFLRVLVHDTNRKYEVLNIKLATLPICIYSASEMTRLCLEKCCGAEMMMVSAAIVELQTEEFCTLGVVEKVNVLVALCNEVMDTSALSKYKAKTAAIYADLLREKTAASKENVNQVGDDNVLANKQQKEFYDMTMVFEKEESDGILVVCNQRLEALKAAKAKEIRLKMEQEMMKQTRQNENMINKFKNVQKTLKRLTRVCPLGTDRNQSLYWLVTEVGCGLLIERRRPVSNGPENDQSSEWFFYDTFDQVKSLMRSLSDEFRNECLLLRNLNKHKEGIFGFFQQTETIKFGSILDTKVKVCNGETSLLEAIYEEMIKLEKDVFKALLLFTSFRNDWLDRMERAQTCSDFVDCLLDLQLHMEENVLCDAINEEWKAKVQECRALSKLYILIHVLMSSIKWDQLPKHAICGVCNKRNQRSFVVICKVCRTAFHANCLSPPLSELPKSGHFCCPKCEDAIPVKEEREVRLGGLAANGVKPKSGKSKRNPVCCGSLAKSHGDTVSCSTCQEAYHKTCHRPPLRNTPRGDWVCSRCNNRKSRRGTQHQSS